MDEEGTLNLAVNSRYQSWINFEIVRCINVTEGKRVNDGGSLGEMIASCFPSLVSTFSRHQLIDKSVTPSPKSQTSSNPR